MAKEEQKLNLPDSSMLQAIREPSQSFLVKESSSATEAMFSQEPIAIVGHACRLPGEVKNPTDLWKLLKRGGVASNVPPTSRFSIKGHSDGSFKPKTMASSGGMFIETIDPLDIDAQFFKLSKMDASSMDPQQRRLLEVVYEGLENAGITLDALSGEKYGCFVGSYASDYGEIQARDPEERAPSTSFSIGRAMLSNRISHFLNIKGPSMTIDIACSGSLICLDVASKYLQTREIDGAIIAGCNIYLSPEHVMDQFADNAASGSGKCHIFDAKADGYIKAEAINMIIVKRLGDALRDKDPIRAIVRGIATNSDGWTAGIASPNSQAQAQAIKQAYLNANLSNYEATSYVECHGTGTRAGDVIEVEGLASVFSEHFQPDKPLRIGSIKSNIGHSEPAAGISGLLKVILSLENATIPGNPTFINPNPKIDFNTLRVCPSRVAIPWPKVPLRRAGANSFGFGGSNAHAIIDETNGFLKRNLNSHVSCFSSCDNGLFADDDVSERNHVIVFSANDLSSLESYVKTLDQHLSNPKVTLKLKDLAFTLSEKRTRHFHRGYLSTKSSKINPSSLIVAKTRAVIPRIGFVFTGQGAKWSQMGKELLSNFTLARTVITRLDNFLQNLSDAPVWSLYRELTEPRTAAHLRLPEFSQPLTTALQLAILAVLKSWGIEPQSVIGHSSGEIAAAVAAGHLTEEDAIKVAYYRGKAALLTKCKAPLGMLARVDSKLILSLCPNSSGLKSSWQEFKILSTLDDVTNEHYQGLIRTTDLKGRGALDSELKPLSHGTSASMWYKAMSDAGYSFGKRFQTQISIESTMGMRCNRALISLVEPEIPWKPDISQITECQLNAIMHENNVSVAEDEAAQIIGLILHKNPTSKVVEINLSDEPNSVWLDQSQSNPLSRISCGGFDFVLSKDAHLLQAREKYKDFGEIRYSLMDSSLSLFDKEANVDFIIIKTSLMESLSLRNTLNSIQRVISDHGSIMILGSRPENEGSSLVYNSEFLQLTNLQPQFSNFTSNGESIPLILATKFQSELSAEERVINIVEFSSDNGFSKRNSLVVSGWSVEHHAAPFTNTWDTLQNLFGPQRQVLWVTTGCQMEVTNPDGAVVLGDMRTVRTEEPTVILVTLDVAGFSEQVTVSSVDRVLKNMKLSVPPQLSDTEYVEQRGVLHISRIIPDCPIDQAEKSNTYGAEAVLKPLHEQEICVRLISDQAGSLDALHYQEVSKEEIPLPDGFVEVDIHAASLNFKVWKIFHVFCISIDRHKGCSNAMGFLKANEHLLGLDGGGTIRRLGQNTGSLQVGQRVVVSRKGSFANRIQSPVEAIYPLPDDMSYEDASTLPSVYSVCLYGLIDLANTQKGQSVLIHSAARGVGIATIQLCKYLGAEIFATVGTDEKRKFLIQTFDLASDHIFTSRSIAFESDLMKATNGRSVDIVLNSLSGDLLDASWRCIADNGTFVEIGKKDMADRNNLSMEPFCRNASYRPIDMSLDSVPLSTTARQLSQTFSLIEHGHIKPIQPRTKFSFKDIRDAFRYMRSGNHIGKIVITDGEDRSVKIPIRPSKISLKLRSDASYFIVGGLKGICGSLAMYLSLLGAKNLVVMSRTGCDDDVSQSVLFQLKALGTDVVVIKGDVVKLDDVRVAFKSAIKPIAGIIQGVMLLRDKMFTFMSDTEFNEAIRPKQQGTWNLHNTALQEGLVLDFFTMLSSICGVVGQTGQANYSAASSFLDAFSVYRQGLGLKACSIDLGVIEDVGYVSSNENVAKRLNTQHWTSINESLLHKILRFSILQQTSAPINADSSTQMVTGVPVPLHPDSSIYPGDMLRDSRFSFLSFQDSLILATEQHESSSDARALLSLVKSKAKGDTVLLMTIEVINRQFMKSLSLSEPIEPAKPLSGYGIDSLVAVESRNWVRVHLGAEITTLEVINAKTLAALGAGIVEKISI
ncbi:hypothetical protein BOTCAL_0095g00030 [Botryotinia calthae]|uniref:Uncharacterized protein n=1 Tax=Botryotinia calthae TaxID=38488 RepID=A0A4Y8D8Z6_9HELO|nr:hypothetical protein BOTCAL_0095g00030 [Botryotinia calthae]